MTSSRAASSVSTTGTESSVLPGLKLPAPVPDVASAFVGIVEKVFAARTGPRFSLVLSGGPTARTCYERLARTDAVEWALVDIYVGDERLVPAGDPDANQRLIRESLVEPTGGKAGFFPMETDGNPDSCAARYQQVVLPVVEGLGFDLIHLGMGSDGHTASLFPDSPALDVGPGVLVTANSDPHGGNPHPRLTLTLPAINRAHVAVFTVAGVAKHDIVAQLRSGADLPAARVHAGEVCWLLDADAAGEDAR